MRSFPRVVPPVVPEGAATDRVDDDEEDEEHDVDHGDLLPVALQVVEKPGFARLAVEAQSAVIVAPQATVWAGRRRHARCGVPFSWANVGETAGVGWLTATRLQIKGRNQH